MFFRLVRPPSCLFAASVRPPSCLVAASVRPPSCLVAASVRPHLCMRLVEIVIFDIFWGKSFFWETNFLDE